MVVVVIGHAFHARVQVAVGAERCEPVAHPVGDRAAGRRARSEIAATGRPPRRSDASRTIRVDVGADVAARGRSC